MLGLQSMRDAYLAGTFIALACGVVGWFVVLRAQVFAGDALSHVALVGAVAAALAGLDIRLGLVAGTVVVAGGLAALPRRAGGDDALIGVVFAWVLGVGILLITLLSRSAHGSEDTAAIAALFGSILTLSPGAAAVAAAVGLAVALLTLLMARPLLLASLEPELATLRGVRVRTLGLAFLVLLALVTAESAQVTGALLLLGLIAAPAGAAHALTARPWIGITVAAAVAVGALWAGLALSYYVPSLPPSTAIIVLAATVYALAGVLAWRRGARRLHQSM